MATAPQTIQGGINRITGAAAAPILDTMAAVLDFRHPRGKGGNTSKR